MAALLRAGSYRPWISLNCLTTTLFLVGSAQNESNHLLNIVAGLLRSADHIKSYSGKKTMSITSDQITHIARLARLKTDPEKSEYYATQLTRIMNLVEQMNQIDIGDIEPMSHPQDAALRLRPDVVTAANKREKFQAIAPAASEGLYLVPKVIE